MIFSINVTDKSKIIKNSIDVGFLFSIDIIFLNDKSNPQIRAILGSRLIYGILFKNVMKEKLVNK